MCHTYPPTYLKNSNQTEGRRREKERELGATCAWQWGTKSKSSPSSSKKLAKASLRVTTIIASSCSTTLDFNGQWPSDVTPLSSVRNSQLALPKVEEVTPNSLLLRASRIIAHGLHPLPTPNLSYFWSSSQVFGCYVGRLPGDCRSKNSSLGAVKERDATPSDATITPHKAASCQRHQWNNCHLRLCLCVCVGGWVSGGSPSTNQVDRSLLIAPLWSSSGNVFVT